MTRTGESIDEDIQLVLPQFRRGRGPKTRGQRRVRVLHAISRAVSGTSSKTTPQALLKITSYSKSPQQLARHLDYLTRDKQTEVYTGFGTPLTSLLDKDSPARREAIQLEGQDLVQSNRAGDREGGKQRTRESMNLVLSMPPGTDRERFERAVGQYLERTYKDHRCLHVFHSDRDHYHAHAVISMRGADGTLLNPTRGVIAEWREQFADSLRRNGIAATATPNYSRGKRKGGYRRDLSELDRRGKRKQARHSGFDERKEREGIDQRRQAWGRISDYFRGIGERPLADKINHYVESNFDRESQDRKQRSREQDSSRDYR